MNRSSLMRQIRTVYAERRQLAEQRATAARRRVLDQFPELAKAESAVQEARWQVLQALTYPGGESPAAAEALEQREAELAAALARQALPEDALQQVTYTCSTCEDNGRTITGPCPDCYPGVLRELLRAEVSGFLPEAEANFENFDLGLFSADPISVRNGRSTTARYQMEQNLALAKAFVDDFPTAEQNLYFTGKPGTGKTFLASAIANALLAEGRVAFAVTMLQFEETVARYRTLQRSFGAKPEELQAAEDTYELLLDADLLVLDDFGVQAQLLPEPLGEVIMLLQQRKVRGRQTILTSNMDLKDLSRQYDERLLSRILSRLRILPFLGDDLRHRKRV